jgi:hypothetical protein
MNRPQTHAEAKLMRCCIARTVAGYCGQTEGVRYFRPGMLCPEHWLSVPIDTLPPVPPLSMVPPTLASSTG